MSGYTPKVGDKVRARLGETVIVGRVSRTRAINGAQHLIDVVPAEDSFAELTLTVHHWQFEQVVSVPSKFGAVIRRADGKVFTHVPGRIDGTSGFDWYSRGDHWRVDTVTCGGFTVLFDGVDE